MPVDWYNFAGVTPPKPDIRDRKFTMVMTQDERDRLEALAEADHRSAADWVRVAILSAYEARFGAKKPRR